MASSVSPYSVRLRTGESFGPASRTLLRQWALGRRIPPDALILEGDKSEAAWHHPALADIFAAPPTSPGTVTESDNPVSTIIPYKNPMALGGYYCAVFSLIPMIGLPLSIIAIVLGILGFKHLRNNPKAHGTAHAYVAVILGSLTAILWGGLLIVGILAAATTR